jgi:hypothetical protein
MNINIFFMGLTLLGTTSCKNKPRQNQEPIINSIDAERPLIIYQTKSDYSNLVPVILSENAAEIVSYPSPSDLKDGEGNMMYPEKLEGGFWLDNRGVNNRVAFLKYTYQEYISFKELPSLEVLYENIVDKNPLVKIYDCGSRGSYENPKEDINNIILEDKLRMFCKETTPIWE